MKQSIILGIGTGRCGTATYSYDPTGQLINATYTGEQDDESYSYDANGNRTNTGYVVGADNRLLSDGTYWYAYDAEGNRVARFIDVDASGDLTTGDAEVTEYVWDARNRLVNVTDRATAGGDPTQIVDYLYDVENRWIGENIDLNGDGVIDRQIRFAYDGTQIVLQFEGAGDEGLGAGDLAHRYLWQPDAVDQLMADEQLSPLPSGEGQGEGYDLTQPGNVVLALADRLGTIRDLAVHDAQTGETTVANHRVYNSFGNLESQTNAAVDCLFGFTGRPLDSATGEQNNWQRWYDARIGQWTSQDPIGFDGGNTNLYCYDYNSPINMIDPSGLRPPRNTPWPKGVLGANLYKLYKYRCLRGGSLDGQLTNRLSRSLSIFEGRDDGAIKSASKDARYRFMAEYALNSKQPISADGQFHKVEIKDWTNIWQYISRTENPIILDENWPGQPSKYLGGDRGFEGKGTYEIKVNPIVWRNDGPPHNGKQTQLATVTVEMRNIDMEWRWIDMLDAHSFMQSKWRGQPPHEKASNFTEGLIDLGADKGLGASCHIHIYLDDISPGVITYTYMLKREVPVQ